MDFCNEVSHLIHCPQMGVRVKQDTTYPLAIKWWSVDESSCGQGRRWCHQMDSVTMWTINKEEEGCLRGRSDAVAVCPFN